MGGDFIVKSFPNNGFCIVGVDGCFEIKTNVSHLEDEFWKFSKGDLERGIWIVDIVIVSSRLEKKSSVSVEESCKVFRPTLVNGSIPKEISLDWGPPVAFTRETVPEKAFRPDGMAREPPIRGALVVDVDARER